MVVQLGIKLILFSSQTKSMLMKKIEAVVRLSKFDAIRDALAKIGVRFFTMSDVKGFGLQKERCDFC